MTIAYPKEHKIFIALYFCTMTFLMLDIIDTFPMGIVLRKIKYLYMIIMFAIIVYRGYVTKRQIVACFPIVVLAVHALIYGFILKNDYVILATRLHVRECLIFYLFVLITFWYVANNHCLILFVQLSYLALIVQLGFAAITHIQDFVNPIYFVNVFNESARYRTEFGFVQYGYVGNYGFCALALSFILLYYYKKQRNQQWICNAIYIFDFIVVCMICSAASRSSVIATILTLFFFCYFEFFKYKREKWQKVIQILLIVGILSVLISYCILHATRDLNIYGNYEAFKQVGNIWTGMGYVENHGFQESTCIYGVKTTSLDVSYIYYYYTTGIIGCVFLLLTILFFLGFLLSGYRNDFRNIVLAIFIALLFYAYWQVNLFTYTYYTNYIYLIIYLVLFMESGHVQKDNLALRFII